MSSKEPRITWHYFSFFSMSFFAFFAVLLVACGAANTTAVNQNQAYPVNPNGLSVTAVGLESFEPAPQLGVVVDGNGIVVHIESQNSAARAGVKVGDKLITVGEIPVLREPTAVRSLLQMSRPGDVIQIQIDDKGSVKRIDVTLIPYSPVQATAIPEQASSASEAGVGQPTVAPITNIPTPTPVLPPYEYF